MVTQSTLSSTHTHTTRHLYKFNPCSRIVALVPLASSSRSLSGDGDRLGGLWLGRRNVLPTADQCRISPVSLSPLSLCPTPPFCQSLSWSFSFLLLSPSFSSLSLLLLSHSSSFHHLYLILVVVYLYFLNYTVLINWLMDDWICLFPYLFIAILRWLLPPLCAFTWLHQPIRPSNSCWCSLSGPVQVYSIHAHKHTYTYKLTYTDPAET